ncbi:MAG: transcription termination factor NusA [Pseudobdellovibrio sp.]
MADNLFSDLAKVIDQVGKDKGIDKEVIVDAVKQAMLVAARKKFGTYREIEAQYNEATGEVELYEFKEVVEREKFIDEEVEIPLDEALKLDPGAQLDDSIGIKLDSSDLGRIAAQTAKQIILQKVRDAEREIIFSEFEQRKGEIASGIARRVEKGAIVVDLGRTEAHIPPREQIPGEMYKPGDRIQGYLSEVRQTTRGPQIIMSRADERYLVKLFEMEVPEIYDGIVEIMSAAREPGQRAKIAVRTKDNSVDPVGACVGMKGSRVQNIVQELKGEKIDIVMWDEDVTRFACNALAPAEIAKVFLDEENKEMEIVVPDQQLSLAIGKKGQNVRLAAKLTGWKLDIISVTATSARTAESIFNLMLIPGMSETMAQNIFQSGFGSFQSLSSAKVEEIMTIPGYDDPDKAQKLVQEATALIAKYKEQGLAVPTSPQAALVVDKPSSAKQRAEEQLKAELSKLGQQ